MRMSPSEKAYRVLRLLLGLRNPRALAAMAAHGFMDADLQEGWALLRAVGRTRFDLSTIRSNNPDTLRKLDDWENKWFPIASATLDRRFPAIHAHAFKNLSQTAGPEVVMSVGTLIDRCAAMAAGEEPYGAEGPAAMALLESRGMTKAVIDVARTLLDRVSRPDTSIAAVSLEQDKEELAKAEEALWAWYSEWRRIARIAVRQRALLREMGLGKPRRRTTTSPEKAPAEPTNGSVVPPPATG